MKCPLAFKNPNEGPEAINYIHIFCFMVVANDWFRITMLKTRRLEYVCRSCYCDIKDSIISNYLTDHDHQLLNYMYTRLDL